MIEEYDFGRIIIDGKVYTQDVIIYPDRVEGGWWRREGHELSVADIGGILREKPEVLVVGTGNAGLMQVLDEVRTLLSSRGIKLIEKPTKEACKVFNELSEKTRVIAALHLTC
jgi:hypothetical protein